MWCPYWDLNWDKHRMGERGQQDEAVLLFNQVDLEPPDYGLEAYSDCLKVIYDNDLWHVLEPQTWSNKIAEEHGTE